MPCFSFRQKFSDDINCFIENRSFVYSMPSTVWKKLLQLIHLVVNFLSSLLLGGVVAFFSSLRLRYLYNASIFIFIRISREPSFQG
mmetsp:Transcript_85483/g.227970  ORF Transcript_85483/g.227970 Transcript_85483/m.227970 type:complete len:86 (+) Transcript_85483:768-1025(+)